MRDPAPRECPEALRRSVGVARNAVEAVERLDQPAPQVVPDQELDGHLTLAALGLGDDAAHPRQTAQHLLLRFCRHELPGFEGRVIVSGYPVASSQAQQESVDETPSRKGSTGPLQVCGGGI